MDLTTDVRELPVLRNTRPAALEALGIRTIADLVHHLPRRHEDRRSFRPIATLQEGDMAIVRGTIEKLVAPLEVLRQREGEHEGRWIASVVARKA